MTSKDAYKKLIEKFGVQQINDEIKNKLKQLNLPIHRFIRRNIVFAHRDFEILLKKFEERVPFYIYTGRGPSTPNMHLGHITPFLFTKYLQEIFNVPVIIQITDDEKYLWKELSREQAYHNAIENIKDIISLGFDYKNTFIFINSEYSYKFDFNSLEISKMISLNEAMKVFGFDKDSCVGQVYFPVKEIAPCFSSSFKFFKEKMMCLIPSAIDQDPFFRLARDISKKMNSYKPFTIYSTFLPDLRGVDLKMSASDSNGSIFLNDSEEEIERKIKKIAFSGGKETLKEHKLYGGNTDIDVSFQYLRYFLESDDELENLKIGYETGKISTSEMKNKCIKVITEFIKDFQMKRKNVSDDDIKKFLDDSKLM